MSMMKLLEGVDGLHAFSVFANEEGESFTSRQVAAKNLSAALSRLPESNIQGPIRTASIQCHLASKYAETHSQMSARFCQVSDLIFQASKAPAMTGVAL